MVAKDNLLCPTDGVPINETKVRVVAGLVLLVALAYSLSGWLLVPILLVADFGLRSVELGQYSPFGNSADWLVKKFNLPYKRTDQAPKRFAARIGFGFGLLILALHLTGVSARIPTVILAVFAALESIAGFCAGCYVYTYYARLFPRAA